MKFYYITENHEQTKLLEERIKSLEDFGCFGVISGRPEWDVGYMSNVDVVVLRPRSPDTEVFFENVYKKKGDFKIKNVSFTKREQIVEFSLDGTNYKYISPLTTEQNRS